ncbi:raffinose family of oligosaccharides transporter [Calocera cornea HHB12733]|uniref:Raffinose family of oligosaccharides transporter n=1 Tax=Calocera cornea HHB12733 TaxID=1353952 RepID=A0A165HZT0_9BASI|nr:raffinose family of oligosaccharides transporter [Calocera cornea HHB12733]
MSTGKVEYVEAAPAQIEQKRQTSHLEGTQSHEHLQREASSFSGIVNDAAAATAAEHQMTFAQAVRLYPKAIGWSILLSTAVVMEGYDTNLLGSFYGYPQFQMKYGQPIGDGTYQVTAAWQSGLSNGAQVGEILGLFINGIVSERFGYRKVMMASLIFVIGAIFINFFSPNTIALLIGEILCGIPWGVFQTLTTAYAAEVCPVALRAYLTTYVNLCWVLGQLISSGILRGLLSRTDEWSYRIPFAIQWVWPVFICTGVFFAPESPWWLVRHGKIAEAEAALHRLTRKGTGVPFDAAATVAMMIHTNELEKEITAGTSYWDCFKGHDLRRTEIGAVAWSIQNLCGNVFMGYSTYFFEQAGLSTDFAYDFSIIMYAIGMVGTISSWFMMNWLGRRTLYIAGLAGMTLLMFIIGFLALSTVDAAKWALASLVLVYTFLYDSTVGPVCYSLVAEIPSTRLRAKSIVISRNVYNIVGIIVAVLAPYMFNPSAWNWKGKAGFFWGASCLLCLVYCYFRLPEPKGRTYGELDILFEGNVPARKFKSTFVDQFHGEEVKRHRGEVSQVEKV